MIRDVFSDFCPLGSLIHLGYCYRIPVCDHFMDRIRKLVPPVFSDLHRNFLLCFIFILKDQKTIDEVRRCANKAWVLGSDYFKTKIELQLNRRAQPSARGGDRRSNEFKGIGFNGVCRYVCQDTLLYTSRIALQSNNAPASELTAAAIILQVGHILTSG